MDTVKPDNPTVLRAVVADDEPMAREYLALLLARIGGIEIVAEAADALECVHSVNEHGPDVLFLDINLPDESGMEVARMLLELKDPPQIVFVTGYEEYAVPAFELAAADYVMKPLTQARLEKTLKRVRDRLANRTHRPRIPAEPPVDKLAIRDREGCKLIDVKDIWYITTQGRRIVVHTATQAFPIHHTLTALEEKLRPYSFFRANEGCLVNMDRVLQVVYDGPKAYELLMIEPKDTYVPVSRSRLRQLRELLDF